VTVRREKHARADLVYPMKVHHDDGDHIVVVGPFSGDEALDLGYAVFEPTDSFIEHFWRNRWYAIAEVHDARLRRKDWYSDVTRPASVERGVLRSVDLELDVWAPAGVGDVLALDEDEFDARFLHAQDPHAELSARDAFTTLLMHAANRYADLLGDESEAPRACPGRSLFSTQSRAAVRELTVRGGHG